MFKHILLPADGSAASLRAVRKGAELAKTMGAEVTLVTVMDHFAMGLLGGSHRPDDDPMNQAARDAATHWLNGAQRVVDEYGVKSHQLIVSHGSAHQGILEAAQTSGADLIVMGTRGAGALERLLVGSQTQRVLEKAAIPVMVLH